MLAIRAVWCQYEGLSEHHGSRGERRIVPRASWGEVRGSETMVTSKPRPGIVEAPFPVIWGT